MKIYQSNNIQGMITLTGFVYKSFHGLLQICEPMFDEYSPYSKKAFNKGYIVKKGIGGRNRKVTRAMILGLVLTWTRTRGALRQLQAIWHGSWVHFYVAQIWNEDSE